MNDFAIPIPSLNGKITAQVNIDQKAFPLAFSMTIHAILCQRQDEGSVSALIVRQVFFPL
jgi:hypothetical protein